MIHDLLLKILDAIEYQNDKEAFISKFENNLQLQAIVNLISSLSKEKQDEIIQKLKDNSQNQGSITGVLNEYFTDAQRIQAIEESSRNSLSSYIQTIQKTLSDAQKSSLIKVLEEFQLSIKQSAS
jgi:hypothetical protein